MLNIKKICEEEGMDKDPYSFKYNEDLDYIYLEYKFPNKSGGVQYRASSFKEEKELRILINKAKELFELKNKK